MEEFFQPEELQTDSSIEIKQPPPPTTYPLLGTQYQAPNFTTFGHTDSRGIGHMQASDPIARAEVSDAVLDALRQPGIGNGAGYEEITRRMYQADSLQSLNNKEEFPPLPPPQLLQQISQQEDDYLKPVSALPQVPEYPNPQYSDVSRGQPHFISGENVNSANSTGVTTHRLHHTAPLIPRRPAPKVPTRSHQTEPLMSSFGAMLHCRSCTYANPAGAAVCKMCSNSLVRSSSLSPTFGEKKLTGTRACPKCTFANQITAVQCRICKEAFQH